MYILLVKQKHFENLQTDRIQATPLLEANTQRAEMWFRVTAHTICGLAGLAPDFLRFLPLISFGTGLKTRFCAAVSVEGPDAVVHVQSPHYISQTGTGLATMMLFYGFAFMNLQRIK